VRQQPNRSNGYGRQPDEQRIADANSGACARADTRTGTDARAESNSGSRTDTESDTESHAGSACAGADSRLDLDGSTSNASWSGTPPLPDHFVLEIMTGSIEAGGHSFPILSQAPGNVYVIAGKRNVETLTLEYYGPEDGSGSWRWTYSGLPGQATGSLVRRAAEPTP
jgi:hypothetical protein